MDEIIIKLQNIYKRIGILWLLAIVLGVFFSAYTYKKLFKKPELKENTQTEDPTKRKLYIPTEVLKTHPLTISKMRERGFYEEIVLPGKVSFDLEKMATIGSRIPGRITAVFVKEGDMVGRGAALCTISSVELGNAQANYLKSKARLDALKVQYERASELFEKKIISAKEFEMANMEYRTVKTEVETTFNTLEIYGLTKQEISLMDNGKQKYQNLVLKSPIAGTVTERKAVNGQAVVVEENLFIVANLSKLWILLDVYEKDLYSVKIGADASIYTLGEKPESVKAKVAHVSEVIDPIKHTAGIRLEVENTDHKLKPGQTVSAKVQGLISESKSKRIFVVPAESVHKIEGNTYVFIALPDGSFEAKEVTVGETIDDDIEIKSGISMDMNIVSQGSFIIKSEYLK